jgi:hypothetical protein
MIGIEISLRHQQIERTGQGVALEDVDRRERSANGILIPDGVKLQVVNWRGEVENYFTRAVKSPIQSGTDEVGRRTVERALGGNEDVLATRR